MSEVKKGLAAKHCTALGQGPNIKSPTSGVPVYNLQATQRLVETAMLAAVGGLAYTLSTLLKLQAYLGYLLPLPVVVAAMRGGAGAGRRTMSATIFLLLAAVVVAAMRGRRPPDRLVIRAARRRRPLEMHYYQDSTCHGSADLHISSLARHARLR
ncbi:hypothetical protein WJX81_005004 [Elliptochloris bilobata]|uniref:Uncharacterized protein n=1 Tax=Elliptochloris bilobata TaxID=381761 RepID=A0AAW1RD90_9CHLO